MGLTLAQKQAVLVAIATRYKRSGKAAKGRMLDDAHRHEADVRYPVIRRTDRPCSLQRSKVGRFRHYPPAFLSLHRSLFHPRSNVRERKPCYGTGNGIDPDHGHEERTTTAV